jgi:riboflavin synthase alpha subunit
MAVLRRQHQNLAALREDETALRQRHKDSRVRLERASADLERLAGELAEGSLFPVAGVVLRDPKTNAVVDYKSIAEQVGPEVAEGAVSP